MPSLSCERLLGILLLGRSMMALANACHLNESGLCAEVTYMAVSERRSDFIPALQECCGDFTGPPRKQFWSAAVTFTGTPGALR